MNLGATLPVQNALLFTLFPVGMNSKTNKERTSLLQHINLFKKLYPCRIQSVTWLFACFFVTEVHAQVPPNYEVTINNAGVYEGDLYFSIIGPPLKPVNIAGPSGELLFSEVWSQQAFDWKVNDDQLHTVFHRSLMGWISYDSLLQAVDTTFCQNGYQADLHDFIRTPEGHKVMIAYHMEPVNMSEWIPGGNPNALVEVAIIQEINATGEVIFEWNAIDHMTPLDLGNTNLTGPEIVLNHANSIDIDTDGHFILSSRDLSEVTKINRQTGEIIWRWGAGVTNEFEFIGTHPFTSQHSVRPLGDNRYILFDNGNYSSAFTGVPNYSRAIEFQLDTVEMTASVVWEYVHPDLLFGPAMGSVQRLPNGNTLINWGTQTANDHGAILTEVSSNGVVALEMVFTAGENIYSATKHAANWLVPIPGCLDDSACNYNAEANTNPDPLDPILACYYPEEGYDCDGVCLEDDDLDTICNADDNCPNTPNINQLDSDDDGIGDACEETPNTIEIMNAIDQNRILVRRYNSLGQTLQDADRKNYVGFVISLYSDGSIVKTWNYFE